MNNISGSNNGVYIFFIILLLLICLGLGGYIAYDKYLDKEDVSISDTGEVLDQIQIDSEAILGVGDSIRVLEDAFNDHSNSLFGYLYSKKELSIEDFDVNNALYASIYPDLEECNGISYVSNNTVRNRFKSIFGDKIKYVPGNIDAGNGFSITFDGTYYAYSRIGNGGYFYPEYISFYDSSSISTENIEVTKCVAYLEYSADNSKVNLYTDSSKKILICTITVVDGSYSLSELKAKYKSKFLKYKYTFVNDSNDNYLFDSIKRTS